MRKTILSLIALLACMSINAQTVKLYKGTTLVAEYTEDEVDNVEFVKTKKTVTHEYVDLGLPSGTLWATCNIGANSPEEYGDYFAWAETTGYNSGKTSFLWGTYSLYDSGNMTKYVTRDAYGNVDNLEELLAADDAATVNWGDDWQMPSYAQIKELADTNYTTSEWTAVNGVNGRLITSKVVGYTDKSIFIPASGMRMSSLSDAGSIGYCWSRTLSGVNYIGNYLSLNSRKLKVNGGYRYFGLPVRAVRKTVPEKTLVTSITLNQTSLTLEKGSTSALTATVFPDDATLKTYTWSSSDESIATVDASGTVTAVEVGAATLTCTAKDGSGASATCAVTVGEVHEYVDLGLPSGILWAKTNIGAETETDYGLYFAWGETVGYTSDSWPVDPLDDQNQSKSDISNSNNAKSFDGADYSFYDDSSKLTKYCTSSSYGTVDGKTILESSDDAATVNLGNNWRMPTVAEMQELIENTDNSLATINNVLGYKFVNKSDASKYIFLPAAGCLVGYSELDSAGSRGGYWSAEVNSDYPNSAFELDCGLNVYGESVVAAGAYSSRCFGRSVRAVRSLSK